MQTVTDENYSLYGDHEKSPGLDDDRALLISRWLRALPEVQRSLDVGCGCGGVSALLPQSTEKWGIDFTKHQSLSEDVKFCPFDISQPWPTQKDYFDFVFAGEVIEHMLDTNFFVTQCFNALRPEGYLILTTPNLSSFANLRYWLSTNQYMWVDSGVNEYGHVRYLAPQRMKQVLKQVGFDLVDMATVSGLESLLVFPPLRNLIFSLFPLRGNRLCILARKP